MFGSQEYIYIHTLGSASVSIGGRKLRLKWPDQEVRKLFYTLLTPLDESVEWERLDRAVLGARSDDTGISRVRAVYRQTRELFIREAGTSPFREHSRGVGLDYGRVRLDARDFRECTVKGLNLLATGEQEAARDLIERALALYAGPFLPGKTGRIINSSREVLSELYGMINQNSWKAESGADHIQQLIRYRSPEPASNTKDCGKMLWAGIGM